jgi:hypothetical protein
MADTAMSRQQREHPSPQIQREYTTPQALELFGEGRIKYRTAVRRAQRVYQAEKDGRLHMVGGTFVAPEAFWRELFARPAHRGRPRIDDAALPGC